MRKYTWDEYYEKFYDWSESTRVSSLSGLTSLGPAEEVGEIISELRSDASAANRLLRKAVEEKLEFSVDELIDFLSDNDKELAVAAVYNSSGRLSAEDMEDLYGMVDDEVIRDICSRRNLPLPEDLREDEEQLTQTPKKSGFFGTLFAAAAAAKLTDITSRKNHNGRCNGDCANCPPHYGYRYGRWYYGHDHDFGCEFGGNKGSGSMD